MSVLDELHGTEHRACCFVDVSKLTKAGGLCAAHNRPCKMPDFDVLVSGFSCKDLSQGDPEQKGIGSIESGWVVVEPRENR